MKNPLENYAVPVFVLLCPYSGSLFAQLQVYESFEYAGTGAVHGDGSFLGDGNQDGGVGFNGAWAQVANNNEMEIAEAGLAYTDSVGNVLEVAGSRIFRPDRVGISQASREVSVTAVSALTGDDTTMWMSFLFVDEGFSGPDSSVVLASTNLAAANNHTLSEVGDGVGIFIGENITTETLKAVEGGYFLNGTASTRSQDIVVNPNDNEGTVHLLVAKVNWKPDGTPDEMFVFNIENMSSEPSEDDAIASATFDMPLTAQQSLNTLCVGETQVDSFDEIRLGATFADVAPNAPAPGIELFITSQGDGIWEAELEGFSGESYSFFSASDLQFDSGALIEGLTTAGVGTVAGPNDSVLTVDENGEGVVLLTLTGEPQNFIRAVATDTPAVFPTETFEGLAGLPAGWTASDNGNGTAWSVGMPDRETFGNTEPFSAIEGVLSAGTNMNAMYGNSASASLVTPAFTVPAGGATLTLEYYIDTEEMADGQDFGTIRLLNAADDTPLVGGDVAADLQGVTEAWISGTFSLPAAANGLEVKLEFAFESDDDDESFTGFYIDLVTVLAD